jgi:Holliday junction resolvase-like predicted endonuclease
MTPSIDNGSERNRLERIAADYQSRGYDVAIQPRRTDLPDFLAGFEPDLIASSKGENIIVEVKTRGELQNVSSVAALEAALQNRPGWRFELVIDGTTTEIRQTLSPAQIWASLQEAADLEQRKHPTAALLLLWSAVEGTLRLLAKRENVVLESLAPAYVVNRLYTLGLLGREQYQMLQQAMRLRNQAAHGFQVSVNSEDLISLSALLRELINEVEPTAA